MKRKEIQKLHQLKISELKEKMAQARKELVNLMMVSGREKTKDVKVVAKKRDEIARIATILREKELLEEAGKK
jgi:ribosomal protein L29